MTSTIPMDLLMVVFAAGEGKLATIPPDIAPIIDELRASEAAARLQPARRQLQQLADGE